MGIEFAVRAYLLTQDDLTNHVVGRIFIDLSPQNTPLPRIVLRLLPGATREYHATGATTLVFADIEVTIESGNYPLCRQIYDEMRVALDKQGGTWGGVDVDVARLSPPTSRRQNPFLADESGVPALMANLAVTYRES